MPYLNLDDGFADHRKVDNLSHGAFRLHVAGLCYSAKHLTDGHIEAHRVPRLMPHYQPEYLQELLDAGVWRKVFRKRNGGYEIHDYLEWNKSRAWWEEKRERDAKRLAEWRARRNAEQDV